MGTPSGGSGGGGGGGVVRKGSRMRRRWGLGGGRGNRGAWVPVKDGWVVGGGRGRMSLRDGSQVRLEGRRHCWLGKGDERVGARRGQGRLL